MTRRTKQTSQERFRIYFDLADELYPHDRPVGGIQPLTLEDFDPQAVRDAKRFVEEMVSAGVSRAALPWPPYLPEAEEFALAHPEWLRGEEGW